jgi:hypothetical protein
MYVYVDGSTERGMRLSGKLLGLLPGFEGKPWSRDSCFVAYFQQEQKALSR